MEGIRRENWPCFCSKSHQVNTTLNKKRKREHALSCRKGREYVLLVGREPTDRDEPPKLKKRDRLEGLDTDLMFGELLQAHITMQIQKKV